MGGDNYQGIIDQYREYLPLSENVKAVTLHEGNTPLIRLENIPQLLPDNLEIFVKFEGLNPTGSFKDRGMTVAVTEAVSKGCQAILCASTGNTSASAAAYAARAGIKAFVLIPDKQIALGKLAQAMIHGAHVLQISGNFDEGMEIVKSLSQDLPLTLVNSVNPFRLQGQKTAAFEVCDQLGQAPDYHALPVGNAGNISAYWMGYQEFFNLKKIKNKPVMLGYQASGAAPFVADAFVKNPETVATAIRIGAPQSWDLAKTASRESQGWFAAFSDEEILQTQRLLASQEGIFCEPASSVSLCGVIKEAKLGKFKKGSTIVCTLTGHGLKDPDIALSNSHSALIQVAANKNSVAEVIAKLLKK